MQDATQLCLKPEERKLKLLIAALERSENEDVLIEIFTSVAAKTGFANQSMPTENGIATDKANDGYGGGKLRPVVPTCSVVMHPHQN